MTTCEQALERLRELHAPEDVPKGLRYLDDTDVPKCKGCATGDPFLDPVWPCPTREIIDEVA